MRVILNDEPWQVATNFIVSDVLPVGADSPCARYNRAYQALSAAGGSISQREAMALLDSVSGPGTIWSAVYDLTTGDIRLVVGRDYDRMLEFHLQRDGTNPE
jgi:hypothetical protein